MSACAGGSQAEMVIVPSLERVPSQYQSAAQDEIIA